MQSKHTWMAVLIQRLIFLNSSYQWLGLWWLSLPISACTGWLFFLQRPVRPSGFSSPSSLWGSSINSRKYSPWFWWVVRVLGLDYLNSRVDCHYSRRNRLYERSVKNQKNILSSTHQCKPCKRHAEGSWVVGNITSKNKKTPHLLPLLEKKIMTAFKKNISLLCAPHLKQMWTMLMTQTHHHITEWENDAC